MAVQRNRLVLGSSAALAATCVALACSVHTPSSSEANDTAVDPTVDVQILAFNDFHGNIRPPTPSNAVVIAKSDDPAISDAGSPTPTHSGVADGGPPNTQLFAGGAAYFATHVNMLRASNPNTLLVSAGDMTGASPLASSLYDDEPTIRVMNAIGVDLHGIGNHEFDHGPEALLRLQYGGCASDRTDAGGSCFAEPTFPGATFHYLAANVDVESDAAPKTLFPPYEIRTVAGAKIGFIGMTLHGTPAIVSAAGTAGLSFLQEVATANALVPELKKAGVDAIVVLLHQGGFQQGTYNECAGFSGGTVETGDLDVGAIVDMLDPAVDAVASAHTHVAYNCTRSDGKLLTSAASYGRLLTQINLTIDTTTHQVVTKSAKNVVVTRDVTPDPDVQAIVDKYVGLAAPIAERLVGQITTDIPKSTGTNGEAPLGDVVADAILDFASTGTGNDAVVGFTNIGGLRDSLLFKQYYSEGDGNVTFEKAEAVTPFANKVQIIQCKGSDIIAAVQQNVFVQTGGPKVLQVSHGFSYSWDATHADSNGQNAADPTSFVINGAPLDPSATYAVGTTDFVGNGGDGYTAFKACTLEKVIGIDIDAFVSYLGKSMPLATPAATRITRSN